MQLSFLIGVLIFGCCTANHNYVPPGTGAPCSPPPGYLPLTCRTLRKLSETSEVLPAIIYGVNVCRVTQTYLVSLYQYTLQKQCGWTYYYYYYTWNCYLVCRPYWKCSNNTRIEPRERIQCCDGFMPRPIKKHSYQYNYYLHYFLPETKQPPGCPIAMASTLLQCLEIHRLHSFVNLIIFANLTSDYNTTNNEITVFAPPNEYIELMQISSKEDAEEFVLAHTVLREVPKNYLTHKLQLESALEDAIIHVTVVDHYYYRPYIYLHHPPYYDPYNYKYYHNHPSQYILLKTDRFANGAHIVNPDACMIDTGVLHLVNRSIPYPSDKITRILSKYNFTMFLMAMNVLGTSNFLDNSPSAHTVLAPVDSAFDEWPPNLFNCLINFDRKALSNIVLFHILDSADYYVSMSMRRWVYTRLHRHMEIGLHPVGRYILLNPPQNVPIIYRDIPAKDGVVHGIPYVLIPPDFNYGECNYLATPPPVMSSATPSPIPSPSLNDTFPTTSPPVMSSAIPSLTPSPSLNDTSNSSSLTIPPEGG